MSRLLILVFSLAGLLTGWGPLGAAAEMPADRVLESNAAELASYRARTSCGMHCLYVMLRLGGYDISQSDIERAVPIEDRGSSLRQLQLAATNLGARTGIYRYRFEDLARVKFRGVIALLAPEAGERFPEISLAPEPITGHYITLIGYDPAAKHILGVDGSLGNVRRFSERRFREMWTGYVLVPITGEQDRTDHTRLLLALNIIAWICLLLWCALWRVPFRESSQGNSSATGTCLPTN